MSEKPRFKVGDIAYYKHSFLMKPNYTPRRRKREMPFIKLTTVEGDVCVVNTENINSVLRPENSRITDVFFNNKQLLDVRETPEEILRLIKEAENGKQ